MGKEPRPRVVHILPHDGIGGVEVAARSMIARADLPCDFTLLLVAGKSLVDDPRMTDSPYRFSLNPLAQLRAALRALRCDADILIFSLWRSVPAAVMVRLLRPRGRMAFFLNADRPTHFVEAVFARIGMAITDEIWADSPTTLTARVGSRPKTSRVISFVTDRMTPRPDAARRPAANFICWSRLHRHKGIDRSLRLIAELNHRGVDSRFDVWGPDDGELATLQTLARGLGIGAKVRFHGPAARDALPEIAARASFFLQLSRWEGMAMSVVEAMQLGLVPVVTAVGEIPRYVDDGMNGMIVDDEKLQQGAERLIELMQDEPRFEKMSKAALACWRDAPLYADDVCRAASEAAAINRGPPAGRR